MELSQQERLPSDDHAEAVAGLFEQFAAQIEETLMDAVASGQLDRADYLDTQTAIIAAQVAQFQARTLPLVGEIITNAWEYARGLVAKVAGNRPRAPRPRQSMGISFDVPDERVIAILVENAVRPLGEASVTVGRRAEDALRRIALQELTLGAMRAESAQDTARRLRQTLEDEGLVTSSADGKRRGVEVLGKDGKARRYQAGKYSEMVVRTTSREAHSAATVRELVRNEIDLVTVSTHDGGADDPECGPYDGKTFSLTGKTPGYPLLDSAPPYHPNCGHVLTPAAIF